MANVIGKIPEFTTEETAIQEQPVEMGQEEVKEATTEEVVEEEKETPSEPPAGKKPVELESKRTNVQEEYNPALEKAKTGLEEEILKLRKEISELRGQKRELKKEELIKTEQQLDELKDLNPDDISLIDRVLRAKGLITKEEANKMFYDSVKQERLNEFLEKHPEYKSENDPSDYNWTSLQKELAYYRMPDDPHRISEVLERAHRTVSSSKVSLDSSLSVRRRQMQVASVGAGGTQRSSSLKSLDPRRRAMLEQGGWTEEEIKRIEKNLT